MRKTILLILTLLALFTKGFTQQLSPEAKISLLICAPGDEVYSFFGHAAIRVHDPSAEKDLVFNYGLFSFDTPHFIWRFAKGETDYQLGVQRMSSFMREYHDDKRKVTEYGLALEPGEKEALYNALLENYKPENRVYRYSHFEDNCATRVRDQLEKSTGGKIVYDTTGDETVSFRNLIDRYIPGNTWIGLGIKLALGLPTDRVTTFSEKMFLPDYLGKDMAGATVRRDGGTSPLTFPAAVIFDAPAVTHSFSVTSPGVVIPLLFLVVLSLTLLERKRKARFTGLDVLVFASAGIAGMILCFTTFVSVMPSTKWNLNLVWALPTHLLLAVGWMFPKLRPKLRWYNLAVTVLLALFLVSFWFLPQSFHWLVVPICLILLLRTGTAVYLKPSTS